MRKLMYFPITTEYMVNVFNALKDLNTSTRIVLSKFRQDLNICIVKATSIKNLFIISTLTGTKSMSGDRLLQLIDGFDLVILDPMEKALQVFTEHFKTEDASPSILPFFD